MAKTAAEKQKAYSDRKRNILNATKQAAIRGEDIATGKRELGKER
jgi:hypothetical protein